MGYAIICKARKGKKLGVRFLALVDRDKTKQMWWISDNPSLIIQFHKEETAIRTCSRLKLNKPRVVSYQDAVSIISRQSDTICDTLNETMHEAAMDSIEEGWQHG